VWRFGEASSTSTEGRNLHVELRVDAARSDQLSTVAQRMSVSTPAASTIFKLLKKQSA
jgi:hypothetical protein